MAAKRPLRRNTPTPQPESGPSIDEVNVADDDEFESGSASNVEVESNTSDESSASDNADDDESDDADAGDGGPGLTTEAEDPTAPAYQERFPGAPRGAAVFEAGEDVIVKAVQQGDLIIVQEPVYRAARAPGSRRWRFHLLYSKGASMSKTKAKRIGKPTDAEDRKKAWPYEVKDSGYFKA